MENMEHNVNTQQADGQEPEKTFTQAEVNKIVQDRLARERDSLTKSFEKREAEFKDKEALWNAKEALREYKLPEQFLDIVKNAENQAKQAKVIAEGIAAYRQERAVASYNPRSGSGTNPLTLEEQRRFGLLK